MSLVEGLLGRIVTLRIANVVGSIRCTATCVAGPITSATWSMQVFWLVQGGGLSSARCKCYVIKFPFYYSAKHESLSSRNSKSRFEREAGLLRGLLTQNRPLRCNMPLLFAHFRIPLVRYTEFALTLITGHHKNHGLRHSADHHDKYIYPFLLSYRCQCLALGTPKEQRSSLR